MSQSRPTDVQANAYAENYVLYGDQSRAFRVAFPDSKGKPESINQKASAFHKIVNVQSRIEELRIVLKEQAEEKFKLSAEFLQQTLATVIKKGLEDKDDALGNKIPHALPAVVSAVTEVNKMNGNHAAARLALGGDPNGVPIVVESTLSEDQALALLKKHGIA